MLKALKYTILINLCSFPTHLWSILLYALNDKIYANINEARSLIIMGLAPTLFSSLIFMSLFSKKADFVFSRVLFLQFLVLFGWYIMFGIKFVENFRIFY
jgi:hypothetical protein